jgi:hypothetical protein
MVPPIARIANRLIAFESYLHVLYVRGQSYELQLGWPDLEL